MPLGFARILQSLVAVLLSACSLGDQPAEVRAKLDAAVASGDLRAATLLARDLVAKQPNDGAARAKFAELLLLSGDYAVAHAEALKAQTMGVPTQELELVLVEAQLGLGQFDAALQIATDEGFQKRRGSTALRLRGQALLGLGKLGDSISDLTHAIAADPRDMVARLSLAEAVERRDGATAALAVLQQAVELDARNANVAIALGAAQMRAGMIAQARETLAIAVRLAAVGPDQSAQVRALRMQGEAALAAKDLAGAQNALSGLTKLDPKHEAPQLLRARIALSQRNLSEARQILDELLKSHPSSADGRVLMGAVLIEQRAFGLAEAYVADVLAANPDDFRARRLLVQSLLGQDKPREALAYVSDATAKTSDLLALAGRASIQLGDTSNAVLSFEQALNSAPNSDAAKFDLALAYLAAQRPGDAAKVLEAMTPSSNDLVHHRYLWIESLLASGDRANARALALRLATERPDDARALLCAAWGLLSTDQPLESREVLNRVRSLPTLQASDWLLVARLDAALGNVPGAETALDTVTRLDPDNLMAIVHRAELAAAAKDFSRAFHLAQRAVARAPKALPPRLLAAKLLLRNRRIREAQETLSVAARIDPRNAQVQLLLARASLLRGDHNDALKRLAPLTGGPRQSVELMETLADAYVMAGDWASLERVSERLLQATPNSVPGLYGKGYATIGAGRFDEANKLIRRLASVPGGAAPAHVLDAEIAARQGDFRRAADSLGRANALQPTSDWITREFRARRAAGDSSAAALLERWLEKMPADAESRVLWAQDLEARGKLAQAAEQYMTALRHDDTHVIALNNLAWIRLQEGRSDLAVELARRAYRSNPLVPQVEDTLGWALVAAGKPAEAVDHLRRAHKAMTGEPSVRYRLAVALARTGLPREAAEHLAALAATGQAFPERADAEKLLTELHGS